MIVAVITPCFQTPQAWLQQCLDSVARQTLPCTHFLVCDGGSPAGLELSRGVQLIRLPQPHRDYGATARAIGSVSAISQGFDAIAWLDADNWYEPNHIETMWQAHQRAQAVVCTSARMLYTLDGELLGRCPEVDGQSFVDTNCFFLLRQAFGLLAVWYLMPRPQHCVGDRVFWKAVVDSKLPRMHIPDATVCYRTAYATHYRFFGKEPPPEAKSNRRNPTAGAAPPGRHCSSCRR
jgi:glycosyltransferase involved in cell wall biosynthesis